MDKTLSLCCDLIRLPSVTPEDKGCQELMIQRLEALGFKDDQIYTTVENKMKCGIGKCGRCNIGLHYVCKDGPVYSWAELKNLPQEY